jgi:small subunit ribosomal protein S3
VAESSTAYGIIGVKVWIFKGDIMEHDPSARDRKLTELKENASRTQKSGNIPQERAN